MTHVAVCVYVVEGVCVYVVESVCVYVVECMCKEDCVYKTCYVCNNYNKMTHRDTERCVFHINIGMCCLYSFN